MPRPKVSQNAPGGRGIDLRWTFIYPRSDAGGRRGVIALKTFWLKSKRKDTQVRAMGCGVFWQSGARNSNADFGTMDRALPSFWCKRRDDPGASLARAIDGIDHCFRSEPITVFGVRATMRQGAYSFLTCAALILLANSVSAA